MGRRFTLSDDEVLLRARLVFLERGYAARTKEISAAVGLTWGALAFRFGDKRELFRRAMLQAADAGPSPGVLASRDLRSVLEHARTFLWEHWPRRLQYRLAEAASGASEPAAPLAVRAAPR